MNHFSMERFQRVPIVGIVRGLTFEQVEKILPVYAASGLNTIEITMNTAGAARIISYAAEQYKGKLNVGAGTVCELEDLDAALQAGAQFIVTPVINPEVITACKEKNVPIFPGAFTPTEIYSAWKLGATMVKVYPATSLGSSYIKDVKAPLNSIRLLPTGGINDQNLPEFIKAGADGFGVGSQLFDKKLIDSGNWEGLSEHFKKYTAHFQ